MGRKKIQIKYIKSERLRNITYNKRKKGLLKKIVQISKLCGLSINFQYKDIYGNYVSIKSEHQPLEAFKKQVQKDKIYSFTPVDYPDFKALDKIKKRNHSGQQSNQSSFSESQSKNLDFQLKQKVQDDSPQQILQSKQKGTKSTNSIQEKKTQVGPQEYYTLQPNVIEYLQYMDNYQRMSNYYQLMKNLYCYGQNN